MRSNASVPIDYLLFVDGVPIAVVEAKKEGQTLTGIELQTTKYSEGVPAPTAAIPVLSETSWSEVAALAANPDHPVERDQSVGIGDDSLASVSLR